MAAIIRIKRPLDEEPIDALILNCKKRKLSEDVEGSSADELAAVCNFAGTLNSQDEDVLKHIKKLSKDEAETAFKKHNVDIAKKVRDLVQGASKSNRYKVVNCYRSKTDNCNPKSDCTDYADRNVTILDIVTEESKDTESKDDGPKYVYDLYYTNSDDFGEIDINDLVSIHPYNEDLVFDNKASDDENDSEDSNAENNWRNDYPDESDMESITEDDMVAAIQKVDLNGDNELSSDDGEEGFVYSIDSEAAGFEEDIDPSDVRRYGERYARFKARNKNIYSSPPAPNFYYGDIDEEEYYY